MPTFTRFVIIGLAGVAVGAFTALTLPFVPGIVVAPVLAAAIGYLILTVTETKPTITTSTQKS